VTRNIRLQIAFDGTAYCGWQRQKNVPTIQGTVEDALQVMTASRGTLHGAGRTDAGVHALAMTANFKTASQIPCQGLLKGLNSLLPADIRITGASDVPADFHSRYSAFAKVYLYTLFTGEVQLPTRRLFTAHLPGELDISSMQAVLAHVVGTHDFTSFEGSGSRDRCAVSGRGAVRTLYRAGVDVHRERSQTVVFHFCGNGFLRHMVRNIVGTVLDVGRGKNSEEGFLAIRDSRNRKQAGPTAPARGLLLREVLYTPVA
jgi:tRNA pseudouridine38-40 synthase